LKPVPDTEVVIKEADDVSPVEYRGLRAAVAWSDPAVEDYDLARALTTSWNVTARTRNGELVGLARVLDDGALYASIWDVIVVPALQRGGLGTELFSRAMEQVGGRSLVTLVGTATGAPLYHRSGFVANDARATGLFRRG
jgi:predicted GNAT family N-acyltransferase